MQETQETWVRSLGQERLLEKEMATPSSILAWESHGQRSLVGYTPKARKELDMTERLNRRSPAPENGLEKYYFS